MEGRYSLPDLHANGVDFAHLTHGDGNIRQGKAFVEFSISHPYGSGSVATRLLLYSGLPRIDIHTTLVNNDERVRYRAAFPTSIKTGEITYEIPFGAIGRPEGELPAQNWVDFSDGGQGVTLLNRGLPGNNVVDGVMMLSLLKCTALEGGYGDMKLGPATVQGFEKGKEHTYDYALIPHQGDWKAVRAVRRGAEFNHPLLPFKPARHPGRLPPRLSFLEITGDNVVLSALKACPGGFVVRLYEAEGRAAQNVALDFAWPVQEACETNLLEKEAQALPVGNGSRRITLSLQPFEIKTLKISTGSLPQAETGDQAKQET
jgi:alpha-mannosidase